MVFLYLIVLKFKKCNPFWIWTKCSTLCRLCSQLSWLLFSVHSSMRLYAALLLNLQVCSGHVNMLQYSALVSSPAFHFLWFLYALATIMFSFAHIMDFRLEYCEIITNGLSDLNIEIPVVCPYMPAPKHVSILETSEYHTTESPLIWGSLVCQSCQLELITRKVWEKLYRLWADWAAYPTLGYWQFACLICSGSVVFDKEQKVSRHLLLKLPLL